MARQPTPGPVVIGQCAEIKVVWGTDTIEWANILHGTYTNATFTVGSAEAIRAVLQAAMTTSGWVAYVNADFSLKRVELKDLAQAYNPAYISNGGAFAGTGALDPAAASLAVEVSLRTAKAGRQWVGRTYLGGLDAIVQEDARHFTQLAATAATEFLDAVRLNLGTTGFQLALAQRALLAGTDSHGNPLPPRAAHAEPIISVRMVDRRFDSQRRRLGS